jgi:hypothetical protein
MSSLLSSVRESIMLTLCPQAWEMATDMNMAHYHADIQRSASVLAYKLKNCHPNIFPLYWFILLWLSRILSAPQESCYQKIVHICRLLGCDAMWFFKNRRSCEDSILLSHRRENLKSYILLSWPQLWSLFDGPIKLVQMNFTQCIVHNALSFVSIQNMKYTIDGASICELCPYLFVVACT